MNKRFFLSLSVFLLYLVWCSFAGANAAGNDGQEAAVYGSVVDAQSGKPVAGAGVYLLNTKVCKIQGAKTSVRTATGDFLLPHFTRAIARASTDNAGMFRITGVPVSAPFKSYTVFIRAAGYDDFVIHNAALYPDPAKALRVDCKLSKGKPYAAWFEGSSAEAPVSYRHEDK